MKKFLPLIFILSFLNVYSQHFGNEWINYNQKYFKIAVKAKGVYRISYNDMVNAGIPVTTIDPRYFQLFNKGVEQYIYVEGESDGVIDNSDFLEFYGEPNTAWFDSAFYDNPAQMVNPNYSMVNDTSFYFLTWNESAVPKRMNVESDLSFPSYTAIDYFIRTLRTNYTLAYNSGEDGSYISDGEGWVDNYFDYSTPSSKTFATTQYIANKDSVRYSFCFAGANSLSHHVQVTASGLYLDTMFYGYKTINYHIALKTALAASTVFAGKSIPNGISTTDKNAWSWIQIEYPHAFNFENSTEYGFRLPKIVASKYRLDLTAFSGDASSVFYDLTNHKRVVPINDAGTYKVLLSNNSNTPDCYVCSGSTIKSVLSIKPITSKNASSMTFADFSFIKANYIIVTHKSLWNEATKYANYRQATGYNVVLVDIDELYNQFGYGINKHPGSIRNFCRYVTAKSSIKPEYLFIIGKGLHFTDFRTKSSNFDKCLVPSAGEPVSDQLFSWKMNSDSYTPSLATGRLAATTSTEVNWYLSKVKEYEAASPAQWMKNIMQFSGGKDLYEQTTMKNYLLAQEKIFKDTLFGANVQNVYKNSSEPIANTQADIVKQRINNGTSILNFLGHAAASGFDQNIDAPSSYDNKGKYPFLMASSCFSGDINLPDTKGVSEQWVLIKDKGTIGFLANVDEGYTYYLNLFSTELIKNISYKNYRGSIGKSIVDAIKTNEINYSGSSYMKFTSLDMNLHGDPAIKTYGFEHPDLYADKSFISFKPSQITTAIDSFEVHYVVSNIAKAFADSFRIKAKRTFPNGKTNIVYVPVKGAYDKDTIRFKLPIGDISSAGINQLEITMDVDDSIFELNELNNKASTSFVINSSEILPVFPYKYSIYPNDTAEFIANSPNPYIGLKTARCQIDLTPKFNTPSLVEGTVQNVNGVFRWHLPIHFVPNQVYYWRVGIDNGINTKWNTSSFIYVPGKTGWSQADFYQFTENDFNYIEQNELQKSLDFIQTPQQLHCRNIGSATSINWNKVEFTLDGSLLGFTSCDETSAYNVAVFDSATLTNWISNRAKFGHRNYPFCVSAGKIYQKYFAFNTDATGRKNMINMVADSVPNGNYILMFTWRTGNFASWDYTSDIPKMEALGANKKLRNIVDLKTNGNNLPYIFFVQKGHPETAIEIVGANSQSVIELYQDLKANYISGNVNSTLIGPSKNWSSFKQSIEKPDGSDINNFDLTAITSKSQEYVALKKINTDVDNLDTAITALEFPYLKIQYNTKDEITRTPGQLKKWQIYFDQSPEGAIEINSQSSFYADTVQEGENVKLKLSYTNISPYHFDSLMVSYTISNEKNEVVYQLYKKLSPLAANTTITDSVSFNTTGHTGIHSIVAEFNPFNPAKGTYDQLEQYHFNNIAQKYFYIAKDKRNPLFDVTFDGVHIMNGDIVSSKPKVIIDLLDENKYFALDDTSLVEVYLKNMNDNTEKRIYFSQNTSNGTIVFIPGTSQNNKAEIQWSPVFTQDGMYQLRIKGRDKSGNESGLIDYVISFEIVTKSTISHIINYPNPFSTATKFIFTLTGNEIPTDLRIQIFTISGKMVKELSLSDLGPIHIGRNITQYAWDGTDNYGDKLANGVYLYRVFSSIQNTQIEHRSSEIDTFFKKGFGKMYLMR